MNQSIPLDELKHDKKIDSLNRGLDSKPYPTPKTVKRRLILNLVLESISSIIIYVKYQSILNYHRLLAPSLLGGFTAMLAQSINQFSKQKLNNNRILKFFTWGTINGCFTVLWYDFLIMKFDNLGFRILIDQIIGAPIFQLAFNILSSLWDHGEITSNTRSMYIKSLKYSYCFWPFFSILSFGFIPNSLMFPANCLANLFWSLVLSKL